MKITLNTYDRTIREKKDKRDKKIDRDQLEAEIANIYAAAIAIKTCLTFQTPKARKMFVDLIFTTIGDFMDIIQKDEDKAIQEYLEKEGLI